MSVTTAQFRLSFLLLVSLFGVTIYYSNSLLENHEQHNSRQHRLISEGVQEKYDQIQNDLKGKIDTLQAAVEKQDSLKKDVETQFAKMQETIEKQQKANDDLDKEVETLKTDLKKTETLKKDLESKLSKLESAISQQIKTAVDESEKKLHKIQPELEKKILTKVQEEKKAEQRSNSIKNLTSRFELWTLLEEFNFSSMLEIGVYKGQFANSTLSKWPSFEHYYGIDLSVSKNVTAAGSGEADDEIEDEHKKTLTLLTDSFGAKRITLMKNSAKNATDSFKDNSIDFIYVDFVRHDYCAASKDIASFYPILKCGGLFAGHDFMSSSPDGHDWVVCANGTRVEGGVKKAVLDFAKSHSIRNVYNTLETEYKSWYFIKSC
jgi:archaellum component FlaC